MGSRGAEVEGPKLDHRSEPASQCVPSLKKEGGKKRSMVADWADWAQKADQAGRLRPSARRIPVTVIPADTTAALFVNTTTRKCLDYEV